MRQVCKHTLASGLLMAATAFLLWQQPTPPVSAAGADDLPKIEPLKHKEYVETIPGSKVKFKMMPIPGGTYVMGSPKSEPGRGEDEGPQHPVTIRPFWLGQMEVTWDEFDVYWKEGGAKTADENDERRKANADAITGPTPTYVNADYGHPHEGHPVICMTQHCAMEYCRWLSKKTGKAYRLPTEAEWEYAARAGTKTTWSFGDDPKQLGDYAWYEKNSKDETHKVGTRKPNPWGLHDMYGNVMEWCVDHYKKDYYASFPVGKPALWPVLLPTDKRFSHVARGGSWADELKDCRSATRRGSDKDWIKEDPQRPQSIWWLTKMDVVGIRVACAVEEQDNLKNLKSKVTRESD